MKIRELWHVSPFESEIREADYDPGSPNLALIKSMYSLVSTATERIVAKGRVPDTLKEIMKVPYMGGDFDFPVKYGYSLIGKVIRGPSSLTGKTVHLMHPHQDYAFADESSLVVVPETIPAQRAVLASNLETALNAIWESNISLGDHVIICGFGLIGALIAILARQITSTRIVIHEIDKKRKELAIGMGFETYDPKLSHAFDLAFNASASGEALQLCIETTLPQSRIVEVSWYASDPVTIRLGGSFHTGQKQIVSSQVSTIPANRQSHFDKFRRKQVVLDLLRNSIFDQIPLHQTEFDQLPGLFTQLRDQTYTHFATLVKY